MKYRKEILLKDGRKCLLKNGDAEDGEALLDLFILTHSQTDFLLSYPDECTFTAAEESEFLRKKTESHDEIEILAIVDGKAAGSAGIGHAGRAEKTSHRAYFGVSVDKEYWGLGIGRALSRACIECAEAAGYSQIELEAVADNTAAVNLYRSLGFSEYGSNPAAFITRDGRRQRTLLMLLEINKGEKT